MHPANHRAPHDDWTYRNIVHISHGDLFRAIDTGRRGLGKLKAPVADADWERAYQSWDRHFRTRKRHLVFFDPDEFTQMARSRPSFVRKQLDLADDICRHRIYWYGPRLRQFGDVINFDPGTDRSAVYGFHYWYWSHPLLYAWALERDPRYVDAFDRLFNQWYDQRDSVSWRHPRMDPIWYELGLCRTNLFMAYYSLFRNEDVLRPITRERLLRSLLGHGRALFGFVKGRLEGGNSAFNSTVALTHLALAMPEFRESGKWIRESLKTAQNLLSHAVYADGGFTERCPSYASFSLGFMTEVYRLTQGRPDLARARNRLESLLLRCYDWYTNIITPLGEFPPFGDAHTRSAIPMLSGGIHALSLDDLHAVVHPNLARVHREQLPIQYNHRAREADLSDRKVIPRAVPSHTSRQFPISHWTVMRSGWKPTSHYMVINHGPIAGHAHREALNFALYAYGEPLALELDLAVTMGYDDPKCDFMRSSRSHNMVVLDDDSVEVTRDPADLWTGQDVVWHTDDAIDYFSAWHRGYLQTKRATVTRKILFVKPHFWVIHDRVDIRNGGSAKAASWYLHSCNRFASRSGGWSAAGTRARLNVLPVSLPKSARNETALESRLDPAHMEQEMYRNYYPDRYFMSLTQRVRPSTRHLNFCIVLYPRWKRDRKRVSVEPVSVSRNGKRVKSDTAQAFTVTCGKRSHTIYLNHSDSTTAFTVEESDISAIAAVRDNRYRKVSWATVD